MLDFRSIRIPNQFNSHWARVHLTAENILLTNPTIVNYWIHIRRGSFYRRLSRLKLNSTDDVWMKLLTKNDHISMHDRQQIYQLIRCSIHVVISNDNCSSSFYAQTKQNEYDKETTIISLTDRLFQSDSDAFVFVAAAVLLREISRAIWPECLRNTRSTRYLQNSLFWSWSGIPEKLWPNKRKEQEEELNQRPLIYITCPAAGEASLVADAGNLFQHLFYNGEVHLYDNEVNDRDGQIIVQVALRVHQTSSSLCARRYLNDKLLHDFFNVNQYSLAMIRCINDQTCPYFRYCPIEKSGNRIHDIVVDDKPPAQRTYEDTSFHLNYHGFFYEFKPYGSNEPQQHYEQTVFLGYAPLKYISKCLRFSEHVVRTDDTFFLENRWLFRRKTPISPIVLSSDTQKSCSTSNKIKQNSVNTGAWCRCLCRIQAIYKNFIQKLSTTTNRNRNQR